MKTTNHFHYSWLIAVLIHPRKTFAAIAAQASSNWLTPMLFLSMATILAVLVTGWLKGQAAAAGEIPLPPDFQYWLPEQQTQYMQAQQARQGATFLYAIPTLGAMVSVWLGWLVVGGLLHLTTTLLGGRGDTGVAMNLVAWANLPFAIRELVRTIFMLVIRQTIAARGVSGFIETADGGLSLFLFSLLALVDIYLVWHIVLLVIGVRSATAIGLGKAILGVLLTILVVVLAQALLGYATLSLSSLSIARPFFF